MTVSTLNPIAAEGERGRRRKGGRENNSYKPKDRVQNPSHQNTNGNCPY